MTYRLLLGRSHDAYCQINDLWEASNGHRTPIPRAANVREFFATLRGNVGEALQAGVSQVLGNRGQGADHGS